MNEQLKAGCAVNRKQLKGRENQIRGGVYCREKVGFDFYTSSLRKTRPTKEMSHKGAGTNKKGQGLRHEQNGNNVCARVCERESRALGKSWKGGWGERVRVSVCLSVCLSAKNNKSDSW